MPHDHSLSRMPCPAEGEWLKVASGGATGAEAERLLLHAAECQNCSKLLQDAVALLGDSDQEEDSGRPLDAAVRERLAVRMAEAHQPRRRSRGWSYAVVAVAAAAVFVFWASGLRERAPLPELAAAYGHHRPFELRIAGGPVSQVMSERGPGAASGELLSAAAKVQKHLEASPKDAEWLHAKGRAELLRGQYGDAMATLEGAAAGGGAPADLLLDLATATAMQGDHRERALELLTELLQKNPGYAEALFNRGLVNERLGRTADAIRDLEECVRVEKDAGWREEARRRAGQLRR